MDDTSKLIKLLNEFKHAYNDHIGRCKHGILKSDCLNDECMVSHIMRL